MRKRVIWVVALAFCAACTESGLRAAQQTLGGSAQRIAGTGDLAQPRFAGGSGSFLTVTDGGQPRMVFMVNAVTLEVEPVSFRPPPPGVPVTSTSIGEFVRDMLIVPDDDSSDGSVTGTGRAAAFLSQASNLLDPGTGVFFFHDATQVFAKDLVTGENFLVSSTPDGLPCNHDVTAAEMSSSGRFVAFATRATNLYEPVNPSQAPNGAQQIYVRDLLTGDLRLISATTSDGAPGVGDSSDPVITPDGRFVAFLSNAALHPTDTNGTPDIYVYNRQTMTMILVSLGLTDPMDPVISANGTFVVLTAVDGGFRQIFGGALGATPTPLTTAGADCLSPSMTPDGMTVAFSSTAAIGTVDAFSDVFVLDVAVPGVFYQQSVNVTGVGPLNADGDSMTPTLSPDGRFVAYISTALNVAMDDPYREDGDANGLANLIVAPVSRVVVP